MDTLFRIRLRQKAQPSRKIMPPKPLMGEAERHWVGYGYGRPFEILPGMHGHNESDDYYKKTRGGYLSTDLGGNLTNYEYEFWVGTDSNTSQYATCRWCDQETNGIEARRRHMEQQKLAMSSNLLQYGEQCTMQLRRCYLLLKGRGKCVVCNGNTNTTCWGLPLCGARCRNMFRFGYNGSDRILEEFKRE